MVDGEQVTSIYVGYEFCIEKTSKKGEKGKPGVGEGDVFGKGGGQ